MSNILKHAMDELDRIGMTEDSDDEMNVAMRKHILHMMQEFANEGHSGFSASYAINILTRLLDFKPLTPLTGEDDEWSEELAEDEDVPAEEDAEAEFNPSDWVGFEVSYKPSKSPKALTFKVVDADDDAGTVVLERDGKKIKNVKFDDLILPEE